MVTAQTVRTRLGLGIERVQQQASRAMGKIHVYDGTGKGKSQAALGIVLRSIGLGIHSPTQSRVMLVRLLKGPDRDFDEDGAIAVLQASYPHLIDQVRSGRTVEGDLNSASLTLIDYAEARRGWDVAKGAIKSGLYSVVVVDELNPALSLGLINLPDVIDTFQNRPQHVEVISTGRNCPQVLLSLADLHSEMVPQRQGSLKGLDIYTGAGKGKSTSALGRALQGIGRAILDEDRAGKVLIIQFLKGGSGYTEEPAIAALQKAYPDLVEHYRCGRGDIVWWNDRRPLDYSEAERGWAYAKTAIQSGQYKMVILDELNCVVDLKLLAEEQDIHDVLLTKGDVQVVITGRFAGPPHDREAVPTYWNLAERVLNVTDHRHYATEDHTPRYGVDY